MSMVKYTGVASGQAHELEEEEEDFA